MEEFTLKVLTKENLEELINLVQELNPNIAIDVLKERQSEMFEFKNYTCLGFFQKKQLIGLCSAWLTVRIYSGKQLEIDNVIINSSMQSKGLGKIFLELLEQWAKNNDCKTLELNTYVQNSRSHKFYFKQNYHILGYHFQKKINSK